MSLIVSIERDGTIYIKFFEAILCSQSNFVFSLSCILNNRGDVTQYLPITNPLLTDNKELLFSSIKNCERQFCFLNFGSVLDYVNLIHKVVLTA